MQYVELGRTGLRVSRLCLGTMNFGLHTGEKESFAILDRALDLGINFIDTADRYGKPKGDGVVEQIIGRWLAQGGDRRQRIVLATKVFGQMGAGPNDRGLSAYHIRRGCVASLQRMKCDHIDLYQMHHIDRGELIPHQRELVVDEVEFVNLPHTIPGSPWEEIWQAMEQLIAQNMISYIGSSNFAGWNIVQACETARARNLLGLVSEQSVYNLTNRYLELEVIPACRAYGVGLICWSPLAGGLLAGTIEKAKEGRRAKLKLDDELKNRLKMYEGFCQDLGEPPATVALSWLLHNPVVTALIIGPRTMGQLESSIHALELKLSSDELAHLNDIFPGPGGEAPWAYAW